MPSGFGPQVSLTSAGRGLSSADAHRSEPACGGHVLCRAALRGLPVGGDGGNDVREPNHPLRLRRGIPWLILQDSEN